MSSWPEWTSPDGRIRLINADCLEVLPSLGSVDAVVTDPPYGIFACGGKWGHKAELQWDKQPAPGVSSLIGIAGRAIIWGGNYFGLPPSRGWLVWYKRDSVPSAADVELAWTNIDMNSRLIDQTIAATNAERVGHPTQKPLRVMEWSLSFLPGCETILDPFAGSCTTAIACHRTNRRCIAIEKEPKYFEIGVQRMKREFARTALIEEACA